MPGNTAYCLSKGGMRMLTRTAGVELAPHNVLVAFLAGDTASYLTATTVFADGGLMQSSPGL
jgi:glucose 1-dehydrogenase